MTKLFDFTEIFSEENYLYFYEDNFLTEERTEKELEFLRDKLELDEPKKILDLACGYGRHSLKLAEDGHNVTGVDITEDFLNLARKRAEEKEVDIKFEKKDMRKIDYHEEFDIVLLLYTSFGYFEDRKNYQILKKINEALKLGGMFCLDIPNRDAAMKNFEKFHVCERNSDLMIDINSFNTLRGRKRTERIIIKDGRRKDLSFKIRLYSFTELQSLLKRAGFKIWGVFGNWEGADLSTEENRMITISQKE